jgi:hypothetical protein
MPRDGVLPQAVHKIESVVTFIRAERYAFVAASVSSVPMAIPYRFSIITWPKYANRDSCPWPFDTA